MSPATLERPPSPERPAVPDRPPERGGSPHGDGPHVLVEVINSRDGEQALRTAAELAGARGRLTAVAVAVVDTHTRSCCGMSAATWNRLMRDQAADDCAGVERALAGQVPASYRVISGPTPGRALAAAAAQERSDVLVVPAARGPLARFAHWRLRRRVPCRLVAAPRAERG